MKVVTPNHHGGRKGHSAAKAKVTLDINITNLREQN